LAGHFQLFAQVHRRPGALFAVAQRRVEDDDFIIFHNLSPLWSDGVLEPWSVANQSFNTPMLHYSMTPLLKTKTPPPVGSGVWENSRDEIRPQLPRRTAAARFPETVAGSNVRSRAQPYAMSCF